MTDHSDKKEIATFAMGCFWNPQLIFSETPGVKKVTVGYTGGDQKRYPHPTYKQVCSDKTGFAEAVEIEYDSKKITYKKLLEIFWKNHNPTQINRQGFDFGTQYRSTIFYHTSKQKEEAESSKKALQKKLDKPIVTQIIKAKTFFKAEDYHQDYLKKRGMKSCHI